MTEQGDVGNAADRSAAARARLAGTLGELQARLSPKALARDAVQELKETGQELARDGVAAARRHPLTVGGAAAAIILFILRRPLGKLLRGSSRATVTTIASLTKRQPNEPRLVRRKRKSANQRTSP